MLIQQLIAILHGLRHSMVIRPQSRSCFLLLECANPSRLNLRQLATSLERKFNHSTTSLLARSIYGLNQLCTSYYSTSNEADSSLNELNVKVSQRLMRQIYARVHPDLFTNHLEAQVRNIWITLKLSILAIR